MSKTVYRLCLLLVLVLAIAAGVMMYEELSHEEVRQEWLLV